MNIPLLHDTFPIHVNKLAMDFCKMNFFALKNRITECTSQLAGMTLFFTKHCDTEAI